LKPGGFAARVNWNNRLFGRIAPIGPETGEPADMRALRLLVILLAVVWLSPAAGQVLPSLGGGGESSSSDNKESNTIAVDADELTATYEQWQTTLDEAEAEIERMERAVRTDPGEFEAVADTVSTVLDEANAMKSEAEDAISRPEAALSALGPAPEGGEPPEAEAVAETRKELQADRAYRDAQIRFALLIISEGERLVNRLALLGEKSFRAWILEQETFSTTSVHWPRLADLPELAGAGRRVELPFDDFMPRPSQTVIAAGFALGALMLLLLLRSRIAAAAAERSVVEEPDPRQKAVNAFLLAAGRGVLPGIACLSVAWLLLVTGSGFALSLLAGALLSGIAVYLLFYGTVRVALAPSAKGWRLRDFDEGGAATLNQGIRWLAAAAGLFMTLYLTIRFSGALMEDLAFLLKWAVCIVIGLIVLAVTLRLERSGSPLTGSDRRDRIFGAAIAALALVALALAVIGYLNLSFFALLHLAGALLFAASAWLIRPILHDALRAWFSEDETDFASDGNSEGQSFGEIALHVLLDVGVLVAAGLVVLSFWGVPINVTWLWVGQLLSNFRLGEINLGIADVVYAIIVFTVVMIVLRTLHDMFRRRVLMRMPIDRGAKDSIDVGLKYTVFVVALLAAIATLGVDLGTVALLFGALLLGVGFGLQSIVENIVSGLILLIQRPIKSGDWIQLEGHEGFVQRIGVISTEISTFEEASVIIPNGELISSPMINRTFGLSRGRLDVPIGVAYGSDVEMVLKILKQCAAEHETVLDDPEPDVVFLNFSDSSLDFELRVFLSDIRDRFAVGTDLRIAILAEFASNGVEIPYPQRDLHLRSVEAELGALRPEDGEDRDGRERKADADRESDNEKRTDEGRDADRDDAGPDSPDADEPNDSQASGEDAQDVGDRPERTIRKRRAGGMGNGD
jgi:small-conductance mechanosensitive channel